MEQAGLLPEGVYRKIKADNDARSTEKSNHGWPVVEDIDSRKGSVDSDLRKGAKEINKARR